MKRLRLFLLFTTLIAGCTLMPGRPSTQEKLRWPLEAPRVELIRVIAERGDLSGRKVASWFKGNRREALFERPYGLAWDGDDLLVADAGAGRLLRLSADGKVETSPRRLLKSPVGVTVCAEGILVTDPPAGSVMLFDRRLKPIRLFADDLARPTGIACVDGKIYLVETSAHRLIRLDPGGAETVLGRRGSGIGNFNFPVALASHGQSLWIGDTLNFRVQRIDPIKAEVLNTFGTLGDNSGQMPRIKGLAIDAQGDLWVSDALLDQVSLYTSAGRYLMSIGRRGENPGEFAFPSGIAAHPDGRVAVADSLNHRIQIFRLLTGVDR